MSAAMFTPMPSFCKVLMGTLMAMVLTFKQARPSLGMPLWRGSAQVEHAGEVHEERVFPTVPQIPVSPVEVEWNALLIKVA